MTTLNHNKAVTTSLRMCAAMAVDLMRMRDSDPLQTGPLMTAVDNIEAAYKVAAREYQYLSQGGMSAVEIAEAYSYQVWPAPDPGSSFQAIAQTHNAYITSYENDVWPLFQGKVADFSNGESTPHFIAKPASFNTAVINFITALGELVDVTSPATAAR